MASNSGPYMSLRNSLQELFSNSQRNCNFCLLTIGINTVAVFKISEQSLKIFDFRSRDLYGMPYSFGRCTLVLIEGLENVASYLQMSCAQTGTVPFEMKGVHVLISGSKSDMQHVQQDPKSDHISSGNESGTKSVDNRKRKCTGEISERKEKHLIARREYEKKRKVNESPEAREKRLAGKRASNKKRRATENQETREKRLAWQQEYYKKKCVNETAECRENRLASMRTQQKEKRANESAECREKRLTNERVNQNKKRTNESPECREKRLASNRTLQNKKRATESVECREKRLAHKRTHQNKERANESAECRAGRLAKQREYDQTKGLNVCNSSTIADEIRKFHTAVSSGSLYICPCCDQLWYEHSVTAA